ncbi:helix-turn-helix domain-containing protein [Methylocystis echinoides]|uniref:Helix-turn-helix domain-containing protein n=1 Tax=Methylocystis echinoides TaxID=29468 RepID=A0A9W6GXX5_9HYPH|nr:helix-turn-helix domain-containing protein [Methylocystis echinoides]GLI95027.1 hypothetical protein LMG27198_40190 [Methylocystis echinoides]
MSNAAALSIVRLPRRQRFTSIDNRILSGGYLTLEAIGMLSHLLSRPDDWTVSIQQLATHFKCGRDKVQRIMNELRDAGHARLRAIREDGRLRGKRWEISEERDGSNEAAQAKATQDFRQPENPVVCEGSESLENRQPENRPVKRLKNEYNKIPPKSPSEVTPDTGPSFDEFERAYPFGDADPCQAMRYFRGLRSDDRRKVLAHAPGYVADRKARGLPVAAPQTYLRCRIWEAQLGIRNGDAGRTAARPRDAQSQGASMASRTGNSGIYQFPDGKWFLSDGTKNLAAWNDYERRSGIRNLSLYRPDPWPPGHGLSSYHRAA